MPYLGKENDGNFYYSTPKCVIFPAGYRRKTRDSKGRPLFVGVLPTHFEKSHSILDFPIIQPPLWKHGDQIVQYCGSPH